MKKFISKSLFGVAALFGLSMCLTSCEDVLGHWEKPTPTPITPGTVTPTVEDIIKYGFKVTDLNGVDRTEVVTSLKMSNDDGPVATAEVSGGKITIKADDLKEITTAMDFWFEAEIGGKPYIAKVNIDPTALSPESDKTLAMATLGDLMGADGKFYADAAAITAASTAAIGVIGYLGNDATTEAIADGGGHGLVLCLKNAAENSNRQWSTEKVSRFSGQEVTDLDGLKRTENVSGYTNTATLTADAETAEKYPAAKAAKEYTPAAPAGTTGWFLPSAQQWVKMIEGLGGLTDGAPSWNSYFDNSHTGADKWEAALAKAGSGKYDSMKPSEELVYWSSSENSADNAVYLAVDASTTGEYYGFGWSDGGKNSYCRVRPVLAF